MAKTQFLNGYKLVYEYIPVKVNITVSARSASAILREYFKRRR